MEIGCHSYVDFLPDRVLREVWRLREIWLGVKNPILIIRRCYLAVLTLLSSLRGANWRGINVKVTMLLRITNGVVSTSNERDYRFWCSRGFKGGLFPPVWIQRNAIGIRVGPAGCVASTTY